MLPNCPRASVAPARPGRVAALALVVVALAAAPVAADGVRHLPPAETRAGAPLELVATIDAASARDVFVYYRTTGTTAWSTAPFAQRDGRDWVAVIPAGAVVAPGVEYYLASTATGGEAAAAPAPEFATADAPHPVAVRLSLRDERKRRDLQRTRGRRSRAHAGFEWVDFGARTNAADVEVPDRYYRIDLDFAYRVLAYPLEEIRFGYTRLEGVVPATQPVDPDACDPLDDNPDACRGGFKVGGWFELGLGLTEGIRFDGRGVFTATQGGFALGARGELRAGNADGNHLAVAVEYLADVGTIGSFRLGWASVPKVPMAMSVEITDLPSSDRPTGVRLLYDIYYAPTSDEHVGDFLLPPGLRLGARVGYAARDQIIGGPSLGLSASYDF